MPLRRFPVLAAPSAAPPPRPTSGECVRPAKTEPEATGTLVISLDCELYWGMRDKRTLDEYRENLVGDRLIVPRLLALFDEFGIRAYRRNPPSWAYRGTNGAGESFFRRAVRYADAFVNLSGYQAHEPESFGGSVPVDVPAARFSLLRPRIK